MYGHSRGGNDVITSGNSGFSILHGDAWFMFDYAVGGNDVLISGTGLEIMYGDGQETGPNVTTGSDIFVFKPGNAFDLIGDFRQTDHDKIDVRAYGFSGIHDPDLHIQVDFDFGTDIVFGDAADGNSVTLLGFTDPLTASDFIF
jgi:hypothetical protein